MYKNIMQSIAGIEIYPLISFGIFFVFFLCLLAYVVFSDKNHLSQMSQLPLHTDEDGFIKNKRQGGAKS
jgi:hypothetical protein